MNFKMLTIFMIHFLGSHKTSQNHLKVGLKTSIFLGTKHQHCLISPTGNFFQVQNFDKDIPYAHNTSFTVKLIGVARFASLA